MLQRLSENILMDRRAGGGCCIARYTGGAYDMSKVDRIMLRFRPIAPKPAAGGGSLSGGASSPERGDSSVKTGRGKRRRAARGNNVKRSGGRRKKASPGKSDSGGSVSDGEKIDKTLPLLPENPDLNPKRQSKEGFPLWLSFGDGGHVGSEVGHVRLQDPAVAVGRRVVVESWVKVESVTETWVVDCYGWYRLGRTDEEKVMSLHADACPGFVSDGLNRVRWINAAYRGMVGAGEEEEVVARVVEKVAELPMGCAGFTCRVRVVTCGKERNTQTVPCDVWRMDRGGFAWRLDTPAALSLGR
ncbi:hypothetical protein Salat_0021800 [Sesamum alatum]|uniref:DUF7950 domain-containing protein n=1 Tax=Sesamum alatum TaxID=300844 RepID=A0AAE2CWQ7_9LAMI|nr:hypothetical protein Salat_0021800 [Sesamum alatum]